MTGEQVGGDDRRPDGAARDLDFVPGGEAAVAVDVAQGQHRHAQRPQAEAPDPGLIAGQQQRVLQRIAQVHAGDADQVPQGLLEFPAVAQGGGAVQGHAVALQHRLRQPAHVALLVVPDVLEDVGHLQALAERDRQLHQLVVVFIDGAGIVAEQLGEHLPHDARHVITVAVHVLLVFQALRHVRLLVAGHAVGHDPDTALQRRLLALVEAVRDPDDCGGVADQVALIGSCSR